MNKQKILHSLLDQLRSELQTLLAAAKTAREAATHEESKPEDQYDTRGLEASYLAGAQAQRAAEIEASIRVLENFTFLKEENPNKLSVGNLVELSCDGQKLFYFLLPFGAGARLQEEGKTISVVTPSSVLGKELLQRKVGDEFVLQQRGQEKDYQILRAF